ncbi:hypothetical protein LUZ61_013251 [Rhynchospora tenuis]|uniref:Disease resistance protein winged helix domain-containing protein n=1 Tax=Rhynchospora tenuis TaxID=198213 RepID=A0AAD5W8E7_9POAL|nr:hypothetical protein LUZ61_013251 [Rhynchospora tenuis]
MKSVANLLADVLNAEHCSLALQDLAEQELRSLFNSYAFHGFNPNNHGDLLAIGDQIIKILHGSPLAAKVIGSLLNSRMDLLYWRRILSHGSLINSEQGKDIMDVLKLSYFNLPTNLKVCFRFCSIFPLDYLFNKKELIEMWITSGFIWQHSCQEERLEDIGEDYFNHLLRKSIFEPWGKKRYVMHDLIHEMARNVSNGECFRVVQNDKSIAIPSSARHVSVHETEIQKVSHLENICSLVITTKKQTSTDLNVFVLPNNLIKKNLRLLKIYGHYSCKLPDEICCLVHLRYLSIELRNVHQSF